MSLDHLIGELRGELAEARPIPIDKGKIKKLAHQATAELKKHLKFRSADMDSPLWQVRGFSARWGYDLDIYQTTDVQGRPVNVLVKVAAKEAATWKSPRRYVEGGSVTSRHSPRGGYGSKIGMTLYVNQLRSPNELLNNAHEIEQEFYSVLIHEVTHLRDLLTVSAGDEEGAAEYYNQPKEMRAFMQQIVDEVLTYVHRLGADDGGWMFTGSVSADFIESALEQSGTWERIRRQLTKPNEKLILKAVSRALADEWPKLQKLYPDDDWDE